MKKRIQVFLFLTMVFSLPLYSQTATPHYVVVDDAQAEISQLERMNSDMVEANNVLEQQNTELNDDINVSEEFIVLADDMIGKLSASAGELYTALQSVPEGDSRWELQNKMDENRQSRYDLENRKRKEYEAISRANNQIDSNRKMIAVSEVRATSNNARIGYLDACIALSLNENRDVESVLDNADSVRREVEQLLNR